MNDLLETLDEGVLTLTLNRPERRNALTRPLIDAVMDATIRAAHNPEVRCLVLTGAGDYFSGGGDIEAIASDFKSEASQQARAHDLRQGMEVVRLLYELPKPTLAAINGAAAGASLAMALACDMRICVDNAKVTTAFSKIGTSGDSGMSYFLPRIVGAEKAKELMFRGDVITGKEAAAIGLVTKAVSADEFDKAVHAEAKYLAGLPTIAIGYMKQNLIASSKSSLNEILDLEADRMIRTLDTEDHKNAITAFINKEKPIFSGR